MRGFLSKSRLCYIVFTAAAFFAAGGVKAETITVTHWASAFYGAPYAVALEKGFFKKHGVDVTGFLTSAGGGTSVRNTLAGELPFGEVALPAAILAINSGQPLKIIGGGVESVGDILWVAQPDSPISSVKDVVGKKVGYTSPGSVTNMLILMCFKNAGIDPKSVQLIAAGGIGANLSAVLNKAIDAGMSGEPTWSQNKDKVKPAFWAKDCVSPEMTQTVAVTTEEYAKTGGDKLRAILAARRDGVRYIKENPDESADITAKAYNGDSKLYREVFKNFLAMSYWGDGRLNYDGMNRMMEGMQIVGRLKEPVDWKKLVDLSFLPRELQTMR
jgi:NitT/TauT family transport system substrate-binding protein